MGTVKLATISEADYHADRSSDRPSLSSSIIKLLCDKSPLHAWCAHPKLNPNYEPEYADYSDIGTIVHSLILQGTHKAEVLDFPDWRTNKAKEARAAARQARKIPILKDKFQSVMEMVEAVQTQLAEHSAADTFTDGMPEQSIYWEEDGIAMKARLDWLRHDSRLIADLKTTSGTANPDGFDRTIFELGYDIQAAFYVRAVKALTGVDAEFRLVVAETRPPYALSVIGIGPDVLMMGQKRVERGIALWKECLQKNSWPGYPKQICYPELPAWFEAREMEKELSQ